VISAKGVLVNGYEFAHDAGFPTTGFKGAKFTLILDNGAEASDYKWESSVGWVKVENGVVQFNGQGNGEEVTIVGRNRENGIAMVEYKFRLKRWFDNMGDTSMTYKEALTHGRLPSRYELAESTRHSGEAYIVDRDIGALYNEWGTLDADSYPDAGWMQFRDSTSPDDGYFTRSDENTTLAFCTGAWKLFYHLAHEDGANFKAYVAIVHEL
ncbi:TPA: hypothetical protein ACKQJM_003186, partial [Serratia marcescens]